MVVELEPYWKVLANYYCDHLDPDTDGSIWDWLEKDYRARRIPSFPARAKEFFDNEFNLVFDNDADATFFILRWT